MVELEEDLVRIAFGNDFKRSFKRVTYEVTFLPNSTTFLHGHRAIDLACKMFDAEFLFPEKLKELRSPQLDVIINANFDLQICDTDEVLPWFNNELNDHQREAVKQVLRADCGIMPHIIYGPPGKHVRHLSTTFINSNNYSLLFYIEIHRFRNRKVNNVN